MTNKSRLLILGTAVFAFYIAGNSYAGCLNKQLSDSAKQNYKVTPSKSANTLHEYIVSRFEVEALRLNGLPSHLASFKAGPSAKSQRLSAYLNQIDTGNEKTQKKVIKKIATEFNSAELNLSEFITHALAACKNGSL